MTVVNRNNPLDPRQQSLPRTTGPYNPSSTGNPDALPPGWQMPSWQVGANVNVNAAPPGSAIEQYYQRMMQLMPTQRQSAMGDLGSILGGFAGDQRTNRVIQGNAQQSFDQMLMEREAARNRLGLDAQSEFDRMKLASAADKRDSTSDAMQKIQLGGWLQQGGNASAPGGAHRAVSDQERAAATGLIDQMHNQLNRPEYEPTKFEGKWDYQPMDPSKYAKPGLMEKIGSYGGLISGGLGAADALLGGKMLGGAKIGGWLGDIGKYSGLGAKIGSIVPGLGTGIGAGIGAAVGGIKKLFGF